MCIRDRISPYARVTLDTQTHSAQTVNIAHPQCAITQPTISTPAADAHDTTPQTTTTTITRPLSKITLASVDKNPIYDSETNLGMNRDCSILRCDEAVLQCTPITEVLTRTEQTDSTYLPSIVSQSEHIGDISMMLDRHVPVSYTHLTLPTIYSV